VPVPVEGAEGKVLYVWFDAPIGYISATRELTPDWEKYWKDPETRMIHFIGKDNIVFHCIIFPAMLKAEGSYILPDNVPANEFLNLENEKISTSRNWAVWLHEYLADFPGKQDSLRYALCASAPETKDNDFTWKEFQARNNNELVAILGNFINRTLVLTSNYFGGEVPVPGEMNDYDTSTLSSIMTCREGTESSLEGFRFRQALAEAMNLARLGNKYLADTEPWKVIKTDPERVKTIMFISLQITANLAIILEPFLPFSMDKLRSWLNIAGLSWNSAGSAELLKPGHKVSAGELMFSKVQDAEIEKQIKKLLDTKEANEKGAAPVIPAKDDVSFEEFTRMDIRTATILEAQKVPKTAKLIKLKVDTGIDIRTIVSGIAEQFTAEELPGKHISVIVNLEPRTIKGLESRGMVLMAEDETGKLTFVIPETAIKNGSPVK
jgi:methionyl-tRNA synthetase